MRANRDEARHGCGAGQVPKAIHFLVLQNSANMMLQEFLSSCQRFVYCANGCVREDESDRDRVAHLQIVGTQSTRLSRSRRYSRAPHHMLYVHCDGRGTNQVKIGRRW